MFGFGGNKPVKRPRLLGLDTDSDKGYYYTRVDDRGALPGHHSPHHEEAGWAGCSGPTRTRPRRCSRTGQYPGPPACGSSVSPRSSPRSAVSCCGQYRGRRVGLVRFNISLILVAVLAASTLFTLGRRSPILNAIVGSFLSWCCGCTSLDDFFVRYQGVDSACSRVAVACVPGMKLVRLRPTGSDAARTSSMTRQSRLLLTGSRGPRPVGEPDDGACDLAVDEPQRAFGGLWRSDKLSLMHARGDHRSDPAPTGRVRPRLQRLHRLVRATRDR